MFDQPELENLLRNALSRYPGVTLHGGSEVTALRQHADHVEVDHLDTVTGEPRTLRARYVLGCDGANSVVRHAMDIRMRDLGFEQRWLVVDGETDVELGHWDGVHQVCDPARAATYMRIGDTRHRWEFRLLPSEAVEDLVAGEAIPELLRPWLARVPEGGLRVIRCAEYTFRAQVAERWRDGRIFLLGDAAHLTPPFIGQGLGAGLRDAANLAWKLAGVLQGSLDVRHLDSYQTERKAHATAMIRLAVLLGHTMTGGGRLGDLARRAVLPHLLLVPGLRARVGEGATPRLRRSTLARTSLAHLGLGGALCPNAVLPDGTRLDDAGGAFVLLGLADAPLAVADRDAAEAAGGTVLRVDRDGELGRWLRRHGARLAVVRPDGTVLAAGRRASTLLGALPGFPAPVRLPTAPTHH